MKTLKKILIVILYSILLSATCCKDDENCHDSIFIVNNSDKAIYFDYSNRYPDTLTLYPNPALDPSYFKIDSHSSKNDITRDCFEDQIKLNKNGIIMYYFYDAHTLETIPWDTVAKKYLVLKRYDLSLADLQRMNWTITYP